MWEIVQKGSRIEICDATGEVIATIGSESDHRIYARLARAKVIVQSMEMLETLIDTKELLLHEFESRENPLADMIRDKIKKVLANAFVPRPKPNYQLRGRHEEENQRASQTDSAEAETLLHKNANHH